MSSANTCSKCNYPGCRSRSCLIGLWHLTVQARAHIAVGKAVKAGQLTNLKTTHVKCTDCDSRAVGYDHRDYRAPLQVSPVCGSCNALRGPAKDIAHVFALTSKSRATSI